MLSLRTAWSLLFAVLLGAAQLAGAQSRPVPDTFVGTTANMSPSGIEIEIDVVEWSDEDARASVVDALSGENVADALDELPTVGYFWVDESPVGYALKYAHRTSTEDGERITVVTTPVLGTYGLEPWTPDDGKASQAYEYSVVELDVGAGRGSASLAADVVLDTDAALVSLAESDAALFSDVAMQEPPYWAKTDAGGSD